MIGKKEADPGPAERGSALIVVLWTLGILSILVGSLAFDAHVEARITSYYRSRMKADYLARSGMEIADMLLARLGEMSDRLSADEQAAIAAEDRWFFKALELKQGDKVVIEEPLGDGVVRVEIRPERARRNVNLLLSEEEWEGVLEVGDVPVEYWPVLIDSFLDWVDEDDEPRFDGAETEDYYSRLTPPYRAKNGPLDTVEELLLVRGFTKEILFGGVIHSESEGERPVIISGIGDLLTVYGDKKINVNAASRRVLMTLPDPNIDVIVNEIIEEREGLRDDLGEMAHDFFTDDEDMIARVPALAGSRIREYVTTEASIYYRIVSVGIVNNVERRIWSIVRHDGKMKVQVRWVEGVRDEGEFAPMLPAPDDDWDDGD